MGKNKLKVDYLFVECFLDTLTMETLGFAPNHQGAHGNISNMMKNGKFPKAIGIIDKDKAAKSNYFEKEFLIYKNHVNERITVKKANKNRILIILEPAMEKWLETCGKNLSDNSTIDLPYSIEFLKGNKGRPEKFPKMREYINTLKQKKSPAILKLLELLSEHISS